MESANLQPQHQLQEQFAGYYSSLLSQSTAESNEAASATTNDLNPAAGIFLNINNNTYNNYLSDCNIPNSWMCWPAVNSMTHQGLSFCHGTINFNQQSAAADESLLPKTKEDLPDYFSKLSEMMDTTTSNLEESSHLDLSSKYKYQFSQELVENHCPLSSFSSAHHITDTNAQNSETLEIPSTHSKYTFSHILPRINISTSEYLCSSLLSSSLDLNLQAADLLSSTTTTTTTTTYDGATSSPSNSYNKTSTLEDGLGKKRRPNSITRSKNIAAEAKKNRSAVPRPSCPPLKVRKEKLGDRIAALQRLVAPYGKTDTASVLTEAIGYIQFLHDQVQTLSVPYMRSSNIKPTRTMQACSSDQGNGKAQPKRDLKSRGLCLAPVSCVSFFNTCNDSI